MKIKVKFVPSTLKGVIGYNNEEWFITQWIKR